MDQIQQLKRQTPMSNIISSTFPFLVFPNLCGSCPRVKRVWRIRYTTQPVRMTGRVGGGGGNVDTYI